MIIETKQKVVTITEGTSSYSLCLDFSDSDKNQFIKELESVLKKCQNKKEFTFSKPQNVTLCLNQVTHNVHLGADGQFINNVESNNISFYYHQELLIKDNLNGFII